jgi:cytochrome oxidase Cu insertion factor (SCO1/SenC/PrrC family)
MIDILKGLPCDSLAIFVCVKREDIRMNRILARVLIFIALFLPLSNSLHAADDPFSALKASKVAPPEPAPDVTFPTLEGGSLRLADLKGKVVILGFFFTD